MKITSSELNVLYISSKKSFYSTFFPISTVKAGTKDPLSFSNFYLYPVKQTTFSFPSPLYWCKISSFHSVSDVIPKFWSKIRQNIVSIRRLAFFPTVYKFNWVHAQVLLKPHRQSCLATMDIVLFDSVQLKYQSRKQKRACCCQELQMMYAQTYWISINRNMSCQYGCKKWRVSERKATQKLLYSKKENW